MRKALIACWVIGTGISLGASVWTGTWKMRPRPEGKVSARTIKIEESGPQSFRETFDEVSFAGAKSHSENTRICDGKEHPGTGPGEVHICQTTGAMTRRLTQKKDGKVVVDVTHSLSADGKVLTVTDVNTGVRTIYDKD
jgi:hypothetical protein